MTHAEVEAAKRTFLRVVADEIRQGNQDWIIGPTLGNAIKAALAAAETVRKEKQKG